MQQQPTFAVIAMAKNSYNLKDFDDIVNITAHSINNTESIPIILDAIARLPSVRVNFSLDNKASNTLKIAGGSKFYLTITVFFEQDNVQKSFSIKKSNCTWKQTYYESADKGYYAGGGEHIYPSLNDVLKTVLKEIYSKKENKIKRVTVNDNWIKIYSNGKLFAFNVGQAAHLLAQDGTKKQVTINHDSPRFTYITLGKPVPYLITKNSTVITPASPENIPPQITSEKVAVSL